MSPFAAYTAAKTSNAVQLAGQYPTIARPVNGSGRPSNTWGRLKTQEWKTRDDKKCRGGKCGNGNRGTIMQGWKTREKPVWKATLWRHASQPSPPRAASRSVQPFCRVYQHDQQTDRHTDCERYSICSNEPHIVIAEMRPKISHVTLTRPIRGSL